MNCRTPRNKTPARRAEITGDLRMKLTAQQVAGNTWCIVQPRAMVPYYQLNEREIILLDSGCMLHGELEEWLEGQGLRVRAILNTHDHWDHVAGQRGAAAAAGKPDLSAPAGSGGPRFAAGVQSGARKRELPGGGSFLAEVPLCGGRGDRPGGRAAGGVRRSVRRDPHAGALRGPCGVPHTGRRALCGRYSDVGAAAAGRPSSAMP